MTPSPGAAGPLAGSGRGYLISAADPALLREIADRITAGGGAVVRTIGTDVLVAVTDDATVRRLRAEHPGALEIEIDEQLPEPGPNQP